MGHAVVEQVFRPQFGIDADQHPVGGLPWLEWLVTAYPPRLACDGHRKSLAGLLFSVPLHGYRPPLPWLGILKLLRDARYAFCRS